MPYDAIFAPAPATTRGQATVISVDEKVQTDPSPLQPWLALLAALAHVFPSLMFWRWTRGHFFRICACEHRAETFCMAAVAVW